LGVSGWARAGRTISARIAAPRKALLIAHDQIMDIKTISALQFTK